MRISTNKRFIPTVILPLRSLVWTSSGVCVVSANTPGSGVVVATIVSSLRWHCELYLCSCSGGITQPIFWRIKTSTIDWICLKQKLNSFFYYSRCLTPQRVTSLQNLSRHCGRAMKLLLSKKCLSGGEPLATPTRVQLYRPRFKDELSTAKPTDNLP